MNGKMNWPGLLNYTVQPSDLDMFQTYMNDYPKQILAGMRSPGVLYGGVLSAVGGYSVQASSGLALMPDGELIFFPALNVIVDAPDLVNPRIDRVELKYTAQNGNEVTDELGAPRTLNINFVPSLSIVKGAPGVVPVLPAATGANVSLGAVTVAVGAVAIVVGALNQDPDKNLRLSSVAMGLNKSILLRGNHLTNQIQWSTDGVIWAQVGSGGGGGAGANWVPVAASGLVSDIENNEKVHFFETGKDQKISLFFKVPNGFTPGKQIKCTLGFYSPDAINNWKFELSSTLVRKNLDAITTVANSQTSATADIVNTLANKLMMLDFILTDETGKINGVFVNPGDSLKLQLTRKAPGAGIDADGDVRFVPSFTEVVT